MNEPELCRAVLDLLDGPSLLVAGPGHQDPARILIVNRAFTDATGYDAGEVVAQPASWLDRLVDGSFAARVRSAVEQHQPYAGETRIRPRAGADIPVECRISPIGDTPNGPLCYFLQARDLTDRKQLEEQLWRAQRLSAIAQLTRGIAHEFNNTLQSIRGYTGLLVEGLAAEDLRRADARAVEDAATRVMTLIHQLLAFSVPRPRELREVDLNAIVEDLEQMLARVIGEQIEFRTDLDPSLGLVRADPGEVQQILINLVVNARDAMPEGGVLTITTENTYPESVTPGGYIGTGSGAQVLLSVSDTGIGMPSAVRARMFDPFFTTKRPGQGTGLGLATVHGLVKQMGGYVWVQSTEGEGTTVRVYLPYLRRPAESPAPPPPPTTPSAVPGGTETILVVEDEPSVRVYAARVLRAYGYHVLPAATAEEAEEIAARQGVIHLLLTDVVLPGTSGPVLAQRLQARFHHLPVVYSSGYQPDDLTTGTASRHHLLLKPFTAEELALVIRQALDQPRPPGP